MKVEIWSDIACPWCFIGKRRFDTALAAFPHRDDVEVHWRSYQLDPSLPERYDGSEVDYLAQRKGLERDAVRSMFAHVTEQAAGEGLDYDFDGLVVANSARAHQLLHHAATIGRAADVKERLLAGHFEQGRDIGDVDYLVDVGAAVGLAADDVRSALAAGRFAEAVREDVAEAERLGVRGVPFFVIDRRYGISGAQPVEVFTRALGQAWSDAHPLTLVDAVGDDAAACGPDGCAI